MKKKTSKNPKFHHPDNLLILFTLKKKCLLCGEEIQIVHKVVR